MNNNSNVNPCVGCPIRLNSDGTCGVGCKELQDYKKAQAKLPNSFSYSIL